MKILSIPASVTAFLTQHSPEIDYGRITIDFIIIDGQVARIDKHLTQQTKNN